MTASLLKDPKSKLHERDSYGYTDDGLLYHISRENGKKYKATVVPKVLIETVLKEMHDHDMTCFLLLCIRYDTEVMFHLLYGYNMDIYIYGASMPFITLTNTRACAS